MRFLIVLISQAAALSYYVTLALNGKNAVAIIIITAMYPEAMKRLKRCDAVAAKSENSRTKQTTCKTKKDQIDILCINNIRV